MYTEVEGGGSNSHEMRPIYPKYILAGHIAWFADPSKRITAAYDGWWDVVRQRIIDACLYYSIPIPYWTGYDDPRRTFATDNPDD